MMRKQRMKQIGQGAIHMIGMVFFALMLSTLAIDISFYFSAHNQLQSASDSGALAGAKELFTSIATSPSTRLSDAKSQAISLVGKYTLDNKAIQLDPNTDIVFGFVNPQSKIYTPATFTQTSTNPAYAPTNGYNAVRISVRKDASSSNGSLPALMSQMLGISTMNTQAIAVAVADGSVSKVTSGLRPLYGCMEQYRLANLDGNPYNNTVRIFGAAMTIDGNTISGCPANPSGNWGFADLRNGLPNAPGAKDIADWLLNGYSGSAVEINHNYSTQSGDAINNPWILAALDTLIAEETVFLVPLIDSANGTGAAVQANVAGFTGFKITNYQNNGNPSQRYIEGRFVKTLCNAECATGSATTGGGVVKLRLAG